MLKRLMAALADTIEMYEDFVKIHAPEEAVPPDNFIRNAGDTRNTGEKQLARRQPSAPFNQRSYEQKMRRELLNRELEAAGPYALPKETLSCKQRLAALRTINKHIEKQHEPKRTALPSKETKKNTAFFVYLQEKRESIAREYPQLKPSELIKLISDNWKSMSEEERKPFYRENIQNRKEFDKNFQKCLSSALRGQRKEARQQQDEEEEGGDWMEG